MPIILYLDSKHIPDDAVIIVIGSTVRGVCVGRVIRATMSVLLPRSAPA